MKTLTSKSLRHFLLYTFIILLCCAPLLFFLMEIFYAKDLDQLIKFRSEEFTEVRLPGFTLEDVLLWNEYNEDILILPYDEDYPLGRIRQEEHFCRAEGHNIYFRVLYNRIDVEEEPYILMSRIPMIEGHDLLATLCTQYGLLFLVLFAALSVIYYYMSRKLWRPFYNTLESIEAFKLEQGVVPEFEKTDTIEFERLNTILTGLLSNDIRVYNHQKKFIENASHELQTPLAIFLSQLDMLLQQPDLTESQVNTIQSLYAAASRMTRLNKNMLLLAKIDNDQFKETEEVDFVKLLYTQLSFLRSLAESSGLKVEVKVDSDLKIRVNRILIESLLNNLIVNAIRHNVEQGSINIEVGRNRFVIRNTGKGEALDTSRIFRRFNRTSEERKGNGLGLPIVYQITKRYGWGLDYDFREGLHRFTVDFGC